MNKEFFFTLGLQRRKLEFNEVEEFLPKSHAKEWQNQDEKARGRAGWESR